MLNMSRQEHKFNIRIFTVVYFFILLKREYFHTPFEYFGNWEENELPKSVIRRLRTGSWVYDRKYGGTYNDEEEPGNEVPLNDGQYPIPMFIRLFYNNVDTDFDERIANRSDARYLMTFGVWEALIRGLGYKTIEDELINDLKALGDYRSKENPKARYFKSIFNSFPSVAPFDNDGWPPLSFDPSPASSKGRQRIRRSSSKRKEKGRRLSSKSTRKKKKGWRLSSKSTRKKKKRSKRTTRHGFKGKR